jgi:hypothetical protein
MIPSLAGQRPDDSSRLTTEGDQAQSLKQEFWIMADRFSEVMDQTAGQASRQDQCRRAAQFTGHPFGKTFQHGRRPFSRPLRMLSSVLRPICDGGLARSESGSCAVTWCSAGHCSADPG